MPNRQVDHQQVHPALALIQARPLDFARHGFVEGCRCRRGGRTMGPYYRLRFRQGGRRRSIYLGRDGPLVEQVRQALAALQGPWRREQARQRLRAHVLRSLRVSQAALAARLRPLGLHMDGFRVRGWRQSTLGTLGAN